MQSKKRVYITRRNTRKNKAFLGFIGLLFLFLLLTIGFVYLFQYGLSRWNLFKIRKIEIQGTQFLTDNELYQPLKIFRDKNMFSINDSKIKNTLSKFPRIKSIKVIRKVPHTLKISVQERIPIAILNLTNGSRYLLDKQVIALDYAPDSSHYDLPIFSKIHAKNLTLGTKISDKYLKILFSVYWEIERINPNFLQHISEFFVQDGEVVLIEKERGVKFLLGTEDFPERINKLIFTYQNFGVGNFSEIDLRYSDTKNEMIILR